MTMKISRSVSPTEHWLTLLTCVTCKRTPDVSPVYKCNYGHTLCYACFQRLVTEEVVPVCPECNSEQFHRHDVSSDFLRKLKIKPGIGRPYRYDLHLTPLPARSTANTVDLVTVEELFQLPTEKLKHLFESNTREKLYCLNQLKATDNLHVRLPTHASAHSTRYGDGGGVTERGVELAASRKPIRCPHDGCSKIIAISSFRDHFKYEHFNIPRWRTHRGNEIAMPFNAGGIQYGCSACVGIVSLVRGIEAAGDDAFLADEEDCFWVMVSGSPDTRDAFVLFWLATNSTAPTYNCTLELTSEANMITMTSFCRVNRVYESRTIEEVARAQACLYLAYCTLRSMLIYGPAMTFRMTIH